MKSEGKIKQSHWPVLVPATLAALLSTRAIPVATCSTSLISSAPFRFAVAAATATTGLACN